MKHVLLGLLLLGSSATAQQGPAATSSLTRMPLTPGAVRVTDPEAVGDFSKVLGELAQGQKSRCTASEYLVWNDADLADKISDNLLEQFKSRKMTLKTLDEEEDEQSYALSFLLTDKQARYVAVLYGDAESVVLGWCQLTAVAAKPAAPVTKPPVTSVKPATPAPKPAAQAVPIASTPPLGDYSCLNTVSLAYTFKLSMLTGGKYQVQDGKVGTFGMAQGGRVINWTSGTLKDYGWPGWYLAPGAPDNLRGSSKNRHVIVLKIDKEPGTPFDAKPPAGSLLSCYPVTD